MGDIRRNGMNSCYLVALKLTDREKNYTYMKCNLSKGATNTINCRPLPAVIVLSW